MLHSGSALLIIGPTGSGKTPLGELLERRGLDGRRCHHFDFGGQLRLAAASGGALGALSAEDVDFIRRVLEAGALLEDRYFRIAEKLLGAFLDERGAMEDDLVVLNGLPRHSGQAREVDRLLKVERVVVLLCTPETVCRRIQTDAGGDRAGRLDDCIRQVEKKLQIFRNRTEPLVAHYRVRGVEVSEFDVAADTGAEEIVRALSGG